MTDRQHKLFPEQDNYKTVFNKKIEQGLVDEQKTILGFFIRNYRVTYLIIFILFITGLWSMMTLPREAEPEVRVPFAMVTTAYFGAAPNDVEDLITDKLESKIKNLENLQRFTSTSGAGFSSVFVEFTAEADLKESFRKLKDAVDIAKADLPDAAEIPVVTEIRLNDFPIVTYSLIGDYQYSELRSFADQVKDKLEAVKDVSRVVLTGGQEREFQVIVNQNKLAYFNLSLSRIISSIQAANFNFPIGSIDIDDFNYNIRVKGKIIQADQLKNIVVATYNEAPVFLDDLAEIKDGYKEQKTKSRLGFKNSQSKRSVSLAVYKKTGGNILKMTKEAQGLMAELTLELPKDLIIEKTNDNSIFVKKDLKTLGTSAIQTFILITLILLVILSFKGALITALAVPMAFFMSFIFLKWQGMTLNGMVLFSLVLSLGLMVDNAIIIIEGINEYFEKYKKPIWQAALLSVWNFKRAIISGTLTTVAAFLPMLLISGIMGEYMSIIPKTLTVTLLSSLFVALVIMPTIVSRFIKLKPGNGVVEQAKKRHVLMKRWMDHLHIKYIAFLNNVLPSKKKRRLLIASAWLLFILSVAVPVVGLMKIEMFPQVDFGYFAVEIELPIGSNLDKTDQIARQIEKVVNQVPELDNYVTSLGFSSPLSAKGFNSSGSSGSYKANIIVNLIDDSLRKRESFAIADELRKKLKNIQGAKITVQELQAGPPRGKPIEVRIYGNNIGKITKVSQEIKNFFATVPGVINIEDSAQDSAGEFNFVINKQKANYYGLNTAVIASTLRTAIYGSQASVVNLNNDDIDITVKYDKNKFVNTKDLENILIMSSSGQAVNLRQVAELKFEPALLAINHRDGNRIVTVTAGLKDGVNLQEVIKQFNNYQEKIDLSDGLTISVGGETEDIAKSFKEMFTSMIVAIILITFILVLQFNSFKQPFIILFSFPLSIIGVIIGLNLLRQPFSITVFIGIVSLAGIVVNDAIVLIDKINHNITYGMEFVSAIINGGVSRMQPIFLTSLTTIAGIIPLLYADEMWRGLSLTIIFGLIFSTALNLIIVPVMYASLIRKDYEKNKFKNKSISD